MLFNSITYAYFLPLVILAYYGAPARARIWVLLAASCLFYANWKPVYLVLILALTGVNYLLGLVVGNAGLGDGNRKKLLVASIGLNVAVLVFYKYAAFFLVNLTAGLGTLGLKMEVPAIWWSVPLGISFFVFEFIHYLVDVYKGSAPVKSPVLFAVFATFFPTQIAGPIKRYEDFVPQLVSPAPFQWANIREGLALAVAGFFKKVLADNLAHIVATGFVSKGAQPEMGMVDAWAVVIAFAFQIYFDFSGYTDLGRGSALMLGYRVPENFARPFLAKNISDFWSRWHISLSTWLRDYIFTPLGGSQRSLSKTSFNLMVTMVLCGLWHGANWTFVALGVYNGCLLIVYFTWRRAAKRLKWKKKKETGSPAYFLAIATTFIFLCFGFVYFRAANLSQALAIDASMLGFDGAGMKLLSLRDCAFILLLAGGCFTLEWLAERRSQKKPVTPPPLTKFQGFLEEMRPAGWVLLFTVALLLQPNSSSIFIYFQF